MAITKVSETKKTMVNGKQVADAWANVAIVDAEGRPHSLGGIPMYNNYHVTKGLIAKSGCAVGETVDIEVTMKLSFTRVDHDPKPVVF